MELAWLRLANEEIAIAIVVDKDMRLGPFSGGGGLGERNLELLHVLLGFRKQVSTPAANVYLRRHVEVPVDVPRIVRVLRCPRRQILRPWLPMPDRCFNGRARMRTWASPLQRNQEAINDYPVFAARHGRISSWIPEGQIKPGA